MATADKSVRVQVSQATAQQLVDLLTRHTALLSKPQPLMSIMSGVSDQVVMEAAKCATHKRAAVRIFKHKFPDHVASAFKRLEKNVVKEFLCELPILDHFCLIVKVTFCHYQLTASFAQFWLVVLKQRDLAEGSIPSTWSYSDISTLEKDARAAISSCGQYKRDKLSGKLSQGKSHYYSILFQV